MTMRDRMNIVCRDALGGAAFEAVVLPEAMRLTAVIFFMKNNQSARASLLRVGLKQLDETGVLK